MVKNYINTILHAWKVSLFIFMSLMSIGQSLSAQCPSGSVYLNSQSAISDFINNYPDCETITGNLVISSASVTDISGLNNKIKSVTGLLSISSTSLTNLNGLQGVETVGSSLSINNNDNLTDITALSNLSSIGNGITISGNEIITSLNGLHNISSIANSLTISSNPNLSNVSAFNGFENVNFNISLQNNKLADLTGFNNLKTAQRLTISEPYLTDLNDLNSLTSATVLSIQGNDNITSLEGIDNISTIDQVFFTDLTALLNFNYFPSVTTLTRLKFHGLSSITNLTGLGSIEEITTFEIEDSSLLTNLSGINSLDRITSTFSLKNLNISSFAGSENISSIQDLSIDSCNTITDLSGLSNTNSINSISIKDSSSIENLTGISNASNISSVSIDSCNKFTSFTGIAANATENISITDCSSFTSFNGLNNFTKFEQLNVTNCSGFTSIAGLTNVTEIERLGITNTGLVNMVGFPSISTIPYLALTNNTSLVSLDGLENVVNIDQFNIANNALLNVDGLKNLKSINASGNAFVDIYLAEENLTTINLTSLRDLDISYWSLYIPNTTDVCGLVDYALYGTRPDFISFYADGGNFTSLDQIKDACSIEFTASLYLEGAMKNTSSGEEHLMRDDLRINGVLPSTSPYSDNLTCDASMFNTTGETAIVDWIELQLRDATDATNIIASKSFLLQRNGIIVDPESSSTNLSIGTTSNSYFIAVSHRNHLEIISNNTVALSSTTTTIDFTNPANVLGNTDAVSLVYTEAGTGKNTYAIIAGDNDKNGQIQNIDITQIIQLLGNSGYLTEDLDLNGQIQNTDITNILNTNIGKGKQF